MKKSRIYILQQIATGVACLVGVSMLAAGCSTIDDTLDDCYTMARLKMEYTYNLDNEDKFADQVNTLDLFVYRVCDSTFVTAKKFNYADWASSDNTIGLEWLPMDDYYIVACGNMTEGHYLCSDFDGRLTDMRIEQVDADREGTINTQHDHFFYGMVEVKTSDRTTKTMGLIKNTNNVNIVVKDLSHVAEWDDVDSPDAKVTAQNGTINHDNTIALDDTRLMQYISLYPLGADLDGPNVHTSTSRVGRLFAGDGSQVTINHGDTGALLATDNLTDVIVDALREDPRYRNMTPNEYLDRCDTYTLTYELRLTDGVLVAALITVNDWNVTKIHGNL
jgi:hypothetical protein